MGCLEGDADLKRFGTTKHEKSGTTRGDGVDCGVRFGGRHGYRRRHRRCGCGRLTRVRRASVTGVWVSLVQQGH